MGMGKYRCLQLTFQVKMLLSILQERLTTEASCSQPNSIAPNLVFHCSQFPWRCENKVREKSQAKSLLPAVGLEGNTEREESVHCSLYGCGNRRAQGLAQQPGFFLGFMSARSLHLLWGLPGRERSESSVVCVCQGLWAAGQGILRPFRPNSHNHTELEWF